MGSECFENIYINFLKEYDKKNDNYKQLKKLILFKILPSEDRAYTLKHFKKIVINPVQFFLGKNIKKETDIKMILKGYLMVILLHETQHYFRALDQNNEVFPKTPRGREGGKMFIKYIFNVESINHINLDQAKEIFKTDTWKEHERLKKIFVNQLEDIEEENINEFLSIYFKDSIAFFARKEKKKNIKKNFDLDEFIRK